MKKIGSILVLVVFLMTLIPTMSTFAAVDAARIYTEDFNNNWDPAGHYGSFASSTNSEIFYNGQGNGTYSAVQGYDGTANSALAFVNSDTTHKPAYFNMKPYKTLGLSADTKLVFNMRFKPQGTPTTNFKLQFNHGNDGYGFLDVFGRGSDGKWYLVKNNNAGSSDVVWIDANEWYGLSVILSTYVKDSKTYISTEVNVYDNEGNLIKTNTAKGDPELTDSRVMFVHATAGLVNGTSIVFDDAKLYCVTNSDTFNFEKPASTTKIEKDGELTVKFDQPIKLSASDFSVTKNGVAVSNAIESVKLKDFNSAVVKFKGLSEGEAYSLNFSGVTSAAGYDLVDEANAAIPFETLDNLKIYTEDFNNNWDSAGHYGATATATNSEIFFNGQWNGTFAAVQGYDGTANSALAFVNTESTHKAAYFCMKPYVNTFGLKDGRTLVLNMRFKMEGTPTASFRVNFRSAGSSKDTSLLDVLGDSDGKYYLLNCSEDIREGDEKVYITTGAWYDLSIKFSPVTNGETTTLSATAYVYDAAGNLVKKTRNLVDPAITGGLTAYVHAIGGLVNGVSAVFDDAKLYSVPSSDTFAFVNDAASTAQNTQIAADGSVTLKFDRPVTPDATMFVLKDSNGTPVAGKIASVGVDDFNKAIVKFSGLDYLANYTLDYTGVKSAAGTSLTTTPVALSFSVSADPNNELTLKGDAVRSGNAVSFDLYSKSGANPTILVAFYNGEILEGVEIFTDAAYAIGAGQTKAITLNLTKSYTGTTAKLFAWEGISNMKPLMVMEDIKLN